MNIKKRISEIDRLRAKLLQERDDLVKKCPHPKYRIGLFSYYTGRMHLARLCTGCGESIGYATKEEGTAFENKESKVYET